MANDFSLDPYQVGEANLAEQYARALRKAMSPVPDMADLSGRVYAAADRAAGEQGLSDVQARRTALGQQVLQALPAALRGGPEAFVHPWTRDLAQKKALAEQEMQLDEQDRARRAAARNPMGPPSPGQALPGSGASSGGDTGLAEALDDMNSVRARVAKSGHDRATLAMPRGNNASVALNLNSGQFGVVPAGVQSAQQIDYAKSMNELTPWTDPITNRTEQRPRWWVEQQKGIGTPPGMGQSGMPAPSGALPLSASRVAGPTPMPANAPNMPVSAPPTGGPGPGPGPGPGGPAPELTQAFEQEKAFMQDALQKGDAKAIVFHAKNLQQIRAAMGSQDQSQPALQSQGQSAPQGLPPVDRGQFAVPPPGQGTANPEATKLSETSRAEDLKNLSTYLKDSQGVFVANNTLDEMERLNKRELYQGWQDKTHWGANMLRMTVGGKASQTFNDSREYEAKSKSMIAPLAQKLGYNPSNYDAQTAMAQIATLGDSLQGRQQIITSMRKAVAYDIGTRDVIRQLVERGYSLSQAQELADGAYREGLRKKEAQTGNPTQAGGKGNALPSAIAATAGGQPPGGQSPGGQPPGGQPPGGLQQTLNRFSQGLEQQGPVAQDMLRHAGNLAMAPFRSSHYAAGLDTLKNAWEGTKQGLGYGDNAVYDVERKRQETRAASDPDYAQSRAMSDITTNPYSYLPAGGLVKSVLSNALQAYMRPTGSENKNAENAVEGGMWALPLALAAKVIPSTVLGSAINKEGEAGKLLAEFPSLKPTSGQINPSWFSGALGTEKAAASDQIRQLNKDILAKAGMEGEITPQKFVDNEGRLGKIWNGIFPKGKVITATPQDQAALTAAIERTASIEDLTGKTTALARLYQLMKGSPEKAASAAPTAAIVESQVPIKARTKAQDTAAAEARIPVVPGPARSIGPLERQALEANQNHLLSMKAEEDAKQQLMQDMIKGEFGHKGAISRWKGTPEQNAKLKAAIDGMDQSFTQETARLSAEAQAAAASEIAAKAPFQRAGGPSTEKPNLGPSDVPPHPTRAPKEPPKTFKFDAANLHQAWKDVSKVGGDPEAAQEVRNLIAGMIERHLEPGSLPKFQQANKQWGVTEDLKRIYEGSKGEGTGVTAGNISAHAFTSGAGGHPMATETNDVSRAIKRFHVHDPAEELLRASSLWGTTKNVVQYLTGKGLYKMDKMGQDIVNVRSSEGRKRMAELLRATLERGAPSTIAGSQ